MGKSRNASQKAAASSKAHYSSYVQVLNADNATASPSLLLAFDSDRYLFNCGEGLQRLALEHKVRISRIKTVLATRASTDTLAGLPGLLLTLAPGGPDIKGGGLLDAEPLAAQLIGPPGCVAYAQGFQPYASNNIALDVVEAGEDCAVAVIKTGFVTITPFYVRPPGQQQQQQQQQHEEAGGPGGEPAAKKQRTDGGLADGAGASAAPECAPGGDGAEGVLCYACEMADLPGKFDPARAKELGVPAGPLFGQLQRGTPVTTPGGRTVQPSEVMSAAVPGPLLMILDCLTEHHAAALRAAPRVAELAARAAQGSGGGGGGAERMVVVVHMSPAGVTASPAYRDLLQSFSPRCTHVMAAAPGQAAPTCRAAATLQTKLNALDPGVFPLGALAAAAAGGAAAEAVEQQQQQQQQQHEQEAEADGGAAAVVLAQHMTKVVLTPAKQRGVSLADVPPPLALAELRAGLLAAHPRVAALLARFHVSRAALLAAPGAPAPPPSVAAAEPAPADAAAGAAAEVPPELRGLPRDELEVVLLGTVSAVPSSYRNVSSYYLDFFARGGALADCGEDSMGQLERRYGVADAERRIRELRLLWVSHMHADHHGGLYPLLARRRRLGAPPLLVVGPFPLLRVLQEYSRVLPLDWIFLPSSYWADAHAPNARAPPQPALDALAAAQAALGLSALEAFPVHHVARSTGLKLSGGGGDNGGGAPRPPWTVVFSGDTRPCDAVVSAARGATLLVHEATFEDELAADAVAKRHSTLSEALGVARDAGAYRALLTHFSSRYPKIPVLAAAAGGGAEQAAAAGAEGAAAGAGGGPLLGMVGRSVAVGFDFMSVNLADLPWLPLLVPACDELLREEGFAGGDDGDEGEAAAGRDADP